ncbi:TetR/AcrR family transcriptional regulator [Nocardioides marmorisolisilvae]|uniref:TetR/AcrR family transcriptional regulator n=1 Tax=Nocardioides marmorisolisilvae TaxID=1542737 RepID=A0A3N0E088_9ACTN|nr:TetR/AcrR family transcriptional regulator [Nocardioides marmorisolisilvae]RNL81186.1 TetR/AcrR family transcriptional regulator [Nocardioides marmorisolisilvae]
MSTGYVESGRSGQKRRTRDHLLAAARALINSGDTPTVEEVAEAAGISRTTAYRYFPSRTELLAAAFPETQTTSALPDPPPEAVDDRVAAVADYVIERIRDTEPQQRAMLRLSLGDQPHELPLRQGRVIPWFAEALAPLRASLDEATVQRLAVALRAVCGIETRVWLSDIAGLAPDEVGVLQRWMIDALIERATEVPPPV